MGDSRPWRRTDRARTAAYARSVPSSIAGMPSPTRRSGVQIFAFACLLLLLSDAAFINAQHGSASTGEWRYYSGDIGATKYSPLAQITKENVKQLRIAWHRPAVSPAATEGIANFRVNPNFHSTPLMVAGVLYASNGVGLVEAMDPETGRTRWIQKPLDLSLIHI